MRKLMITHAAGLQEELLQIVQPHYAHFASQFGYQFEVGEVDVGDRSAHWAKIALLREALHKADVVLWVDNDFVLKSATDPEEEFHSHDFQALCLEATPQGPAPNTGFWLLRNSEEAQSFLKEVWERGPLKDATLNDQATVSHLLGFSYLPNYTKPIRGSKYLPRTGWLDYRWNMLAQNHPEAPLIAKGTHFGGVPLHVKTHLIKQHIIRERLAGWEGLIDDPERWMREMSSPARDVFNHPWKNE